MQAQLWRAQGASIRLELPRLAALVDALDPAQGVHQLQVDGRPLVDAQLLEVELRAVEPADAQAAVDFFLRGGDLALTYAERPEPAMRAQIYWRAASHNLPGTIAAIELLASVETSRLDSCPKLATRSELVVDSAFRLHDLARGTFAEIKGAADHGPREDDNGVSGWLFRLSDANVSYAEMAHPADVQQSRYASRPHGQGQRIELGHELFAERLEKGVILRARVLGLLVDRAGDQRAAAQHFAAFLAEELPLTT